jgi:hypothetical protein
MQTSVFTFEDEYLEHFEQEDMLAAFTWPNSPATPTQTPVTQTHVMPTHDSVDTSMEVGDPGMTADADPGISVRRCATHAAGAEHVAVETQVVLDNPFSQLDSLHSNSCHIDAREQNLEEKARKRNVEKLRNMQRSVCEVDALLTAGGWIQNSLQDGPASDEEDPTFEDLSTFEGVSDVSPQDDYVRQPFPGECHVPDTRPGNAAGFGEIPEAIVFPPTEFRVRRTLPPDIEQYLDTIAPDNGRLVKVSSRPNASGHRVGMRLDLGLTRQMFEDDATVRSVGAWRKVFCVIQVELTAQGTETRSLGPEKMCCCGTWPLGAGITHRVSLVHRLRDCPHWRAQSTQTEVEP